MTPHALARKNLDRRLAPLRQAGLGQRPPHGWIRAIRDALGMNSRQAAARMGVVQSTYSRLEKSEVEGTITLASLRKAAEALDCTLVYALVPNETLDETVRERARKIADARFARVHHTMQLEDQAMAPGGLAEERARFAEDLQQGDPRRLWDEV